MSKANEWKQPFRIFSEETGISNRVLLLLVAAIVYGELCILVCFWVLETELEPIPEKVAIISYSTRS